MRYDLCLQSLTNCAYHYNYKETWLCILLFDELGFTMVQILYIILWFILQQYPLIVLQRSGSSAPSPPLTPLLCLYTSHTILQIILLLLYSLCDSMLSEVTTNT